RTCGHWLVTVAAAALLSLGSGAETASAHGLATGFVDSVYLSPNAATRARWLDRSRQEDAGIVRLNVSWRGIATAKPQHARSAADPAYSFGALDGTVVDASSRGIPLMLTVFDAPKWAEGRHRPGGVPAGAWKANPGAFGNFARGLASRYSGHFVNGSGVTLPRGRY